MASDAPAAPRVPTHRQVIMSPAIALPPHTLTEAPPSRSIAIGAWRITTTSTTISNARELDALGIAVPPPEMTFGANAIALAHAPSGVAYAFRAPHALRAVRAGALRPGDGGVQVGYAAAWLASRCVRPRPTLAPRAR
jgi:type 2A phosphatase activator TIP41